MEKFSVSLDEISKSVEDLIKDGATVPIYVSGNSMNPFLINRRDVVYLRLFDDGELKKGRIILFKRLDGRLGLHRIKSVLSEKLFRVNGDAQSFCELVKKSDVVAVVTEIERKGKRKPADAFCYKFFDFFWQLLMPLRPLIMRAWYKLERMKSDK